MGLQDGKIILRGSSIRPKTSQKYRGYAYCGNIYSLPSIGIYSFLRSTIPWQSRYDFPGARKELPCTNNSVESRKLLHVLITAKIAPSVRAWKWLQAFCRRRSLWAGECQAFYYPFECIMLIRINFYFFHVKVKHTSFSLPGNSNQCPAACLLFTDRSLKIGSSFDLRLPVYANTVLAYVRCQAQKGSLIIGGSLCLFIRTPCTDRAVAGICEHALFDTSQTRKSAMSVNLPQPLHAIVGIPSITE